jgi:hypothetical protein
MKINYQSHLHINYLKHVDLVNVHVMEVNLIDELEVEFDEGMEHEKLLEVFFIGFIYLVNQ